MWQKKDIVNEFQRLGKRITKQRMVILDVILEQNWTDCKEVYYEAVQRDSSGGCFPQSTARSACWRRWGRLKARLPVCIYGETGVRADGENEVIAPEFHGKNGLRQIEKEKEKCCSVSAS